MHDNYRDIMALTDMEPLWYDQNGTPRFAEFDPTFCPNIYAKTVFLLLIRCQHCGREFQVEMHEHYYTEIEHPKHLHYGDPPNHGCIGDSMNCDDVQILQAWRYKSLKGWWRMPEYEGDMQLAREEAD